MAKAVIIDDNSKFISQKQKEQLYKALEAIGQRCRDYAKVEAPVDTGELKRSIDYEADKRLILTVGSTAEHAPYVELGTGPHYIKPPKWMTNLAQKGHHTSDPWWYLNDEGGWSLGWFVTSRPFLKPAVMDHVEEYEDVIKDYLSHG